MPESLTPEAAALPRVDRAGATVAGRRGEAAGTTVPPALIAALQSCATEADVAQVLYQGLRPLFGYEVVGLHVLEREGWYHAVGVDEGILQDRVRRPMAESMTRPLYEEGEPAVMHPEICPTASRGPGGERVPATVIWVPLERGGEVLGSVLYQTYVHREVPDAEIGFLRQLHAHLAAIVASAYLNEVTRDQAVRLAALNSVARELASTRDEAGVLAALMLTLRRLVRVDRVQLATRTKLGRMRILERTANPAGVEEWRTRGSESPAARRVLDGGPSRLVRTGHRCSIWVPVREGGEVVAALSILAAEAGAYESSTVSFLEQVADQVAIALRNAANYAEVEAQRRRLEVVNAVGRRLATSLDSWSIMRVLRQELARHLRFDIFIMATIHLDEDGPRAEGYAYDSGHEQPVPRVPLAVTGPSREAYVTARPVLISDSPWADAAEASPPDQRGWVVGSGAAVFVTATQGRRRAAARSLVWVPVLRENRVEALLSLQSYRTGAFGPEEVRLLEDVAGHVSLALTNAEHFAAAQAERRRLEMLHEVELGLAAVDPSQPVEARAELGRLVATALQPWSGALWLAEADLLARQPDGAVLPWEGTPDQLAAACLPGAVDARAELLAVGDRPVGVLVADLGLDAEEGRRLLDLLGPQISAVLGRVGLIEAKDLMLRAIGHEVQGPAAAMRATLASLLQWDLEMEPERRTLLLAEAYDMSDRLLSLVQAQLLVARLETGAFEPSPSPTDLAAVVAQVLGVLAHRYGERVALVEVLLPPGLPAALCEPAHLAQVLTNLIGNALEYGGGTPVLVAAGVADGVLEVAVSDDGPGIDPERRRTVFLKPGRAGQNRRGGGLGIGLYLCALVVERSFGGRIWMVPEPGGAGFRFTVPAAPA